jgi:hypothetical protein
MQLVVFFLFRLGFWLEVLVALQLLLLHGFLLSLQLSFDFRDAKFDLIPLLLGNVC